MAKINYAKLYTLRADGRYQYAYTGADGLRKYLYDRDPEKLHQKVQEIGKLPEPTFREIAEAWQREHVEKLSRGSQKTYVAPINRAIKASGDLPISKVSAEIINRELMRERAEGYSYKHAALLKSIYKQVLNFAIVKGHILINPALSVKVPRGLPRGRRKAPEKDLIKQVEAALHEPFGLFAAILLYTGMRTEEAVALRWGDIDDKRKVITVSRAVDLHGPPLIKEAKTEAGEREIPILAKLEPHIKQPKNAKGNDYLFNIDGKLLTRSQITARWVKWCRAAGLAEPKVFENRHRGDRECSRTEWRATITPHQLRHNFATVLFEAEIDELTAKDLMGHTDIATTRAIYTSLRKEHKEDQIKKLDKAF